MCGPGKSQGVNLDGQQWPESIRKGSNTVFTLKTPMTLSYSVPSLTSKTSSLHRPRDNRSTLSLTCAAVYVFPVKAQVKGLRLRESGTGEEFSPRINSSMEVVSGGSKGSFGAHDGG